MLINEGVPTIDIELEVERVRRNEPEDRQEHPEFSPATRLDPAVLDDPVDLFSGQFLVVAKSRVTLLDRPGAEHLAFVASGGVARGSKR